MGPMKDSKLKLLMAISKSGDGLLLSADLCMNQRKLCTMNLRMKHRMYRQLFLARRWPHHQSL